MSALSLLKSIFLEIFVVTVCIIGIPGFLIFIACCTPVYIFRYFVKISAKFFRPDLFKILPTRSAFVAVDDLHNRPRSGLVVCIVGEADIDHFKFQETVRRNLLEATRPDGSLIRPEMTHYISQWMGFSFWKKDPKFNIHSHFRVYDGPSKREEYTAMEFFAVASELATTPFAKFRSPWEFIFFPNCIDEKKGTRGTGICLRIHHSLADGFSIFKIFAAITTTKGQFLPKEKKEVRKRGGIRRICEIIGIVFGAAYETIKLLIEIRIFDSNAWHIPESKLSNKFNGAAFEKIPVNYVKEIKNLAGCSFTSVLFASFAGGIRNTMLEQGVKVPKAIHCFTPLPVSGHPDKLRNYLTACIVSLPVGIADPVERLQTIEKHLEKIKKSKLPICFFALAPLIGGLFAPFTKISSRQHFFTAIVSNFPGPRDPAFVEGVPVNDLLFTGGTLPGNIGVGLTSISYKGDLRIMAGVDESILPPSYPPRTFVDHVARELDVLKQRLSV